jgi:outer membrane protein TolC
MHSVCQKYGYSLFALFCFISISLVAQTPQDTIAKYSLPECVNYALVNQPVVKQSLLDEDINNRNIRLALSGWWLQLGSSGNLQHYLKQPVSFFPNLSDPAGPKQTLTTGVINSSTIQFSANQNIYNSDLFFAGSTAKDLRKRATENTQGYKIEVVVSVSKAFYDILLSERQIDVLAQDFQRLNRNYTDALNRYHSGISDKTDYQRAMLSVNNAKSEIKGAEEGLKVKYAYMKQLMGYPTEKPLAISFDSSTVEKEMLIDTMQNLKFDNRIEYQLLQTSLNLQKAEIGYYKWSFLPSIYAFGDYNIIYQNDLFPPLYNKAFPNSLIGLNLSLPLFQGSSRLQKIQKAKLQYKRIELDVDNLKNRINTEYAQAIAIYKSHLNELGLDRESIKTATDIFNIIKSQYNQGIRTYLDVIVAETDLRTAQLNYLDALYQVLSSALDVKKALGNILVK